MLSRLTTSRRSHLSVVVGFILLTLLTLVLLAVRPADGRSALARFRAFTVREYLLPHKDAYAHDPAVAADGGVYFADQQGHYIGHLDPETGKVTEYPTPAAKSGPHDESLSLVTRRRHSRGNLHITHENDGAQRPAVSLS